MLRDNLITANLKASLTFLSTALGVGQRLCVKVVDAGLVNSFIHSFIHSLLRFLKRPFKVTTQKSRA